MRASLKVSTKTNSQARVFCDILIGAHKLPSQAQMEAEIKEYQREMARVYVKSRRHTIQAHCKRRATKKCSLQVDYALFMDELAEMIECRPSVMELAWKDPVLAYHVLTGPQSAYQYR